MPEPYQKIGFFLCRRITSSVMASFLNKAILLLFSAQKLHGSNWPWHLLSFQFWKYLDFCQRSILKMPRILRSCRHNHWAHAHGGMIPETPPNFHDHARLLVGTLSEHRFCCFVQGNHLECNCWVFKQGPFVATSTDEYYTGVNGRGMRRALCFENALIFTGG